MKFVKYFLQKRSVTILLLALVLAGGLFSYIKMGKLEDAPFTIKQALVLTPYPGASPSEVQTQVTDILEEAIQSMGELYYLKTENRAGLSKITVYVKKEIRADEMQQLWDKLRRKVNDVQGKLPAGAGASIVNDDFGDVLGVFYGLTGDNYSFRELEDEAKLIKNELLKVKDVAKVEIYGVQTPTIDVTISPAVMAQSGVTTADIAHAFEAQNKVVDAGGVDAGSNRIRIESTGNFYSLDDIRELTIVSRTGEHFRLADIANIEESYQNPPGNIMRIDGSPAIGIAISTVPTGNVVDMAKAVQITLDKFKETMPEGFTLTAIYDQGYESDIELNYFRTHSSSHSIVLYRIQEWYSDRQRTGILHLRHANSHDGFRHSLATHVTGRNHYRHGYAGGQRHCGIRFGISQYGTGHAQTSCHHACLFIHCTTFTGCHYHCHTDFPTDILLSAYHRRIAFVTGHRHRSFPDVQLGIRLDTNPILHSGVCTPSTSGGVESRSFRRQIL